MGTQVSDSERISTADVEPCEACAQIGPLLVARGTSGRSWTCGCGYVWTPPSPVNLDDVEGCPLAERCESCGDGEDLVVATFDTPVGVYCATVCADCIGAQRFEKLGWSATVARVIDHCQHLGIDADDMAEALDAAYR